MTTLNDINKVDNVTSVLAAHVNDLIASTLRAEYTNTETLSATRTLLAVDMPIQRFNCNGANRIVKCPTANTTTNHLYLIVNATSSGTYVITLQSNDGTITHAMVAVGSSVLLIPDGNGGYAVVPAGNTSDCYNYLINGGFDFAQRQTPGTLTTIADKSWGADRWQQFAENASWQYQRNDATGESGLTSKYYGLFKKITSTGKGIFVQKVEGVNSVPLRGKTVTFQIKMKASASKTIRMAVLELQTGGTMDAFPAAIASAFGANTVDPTWGTNVAVITAAESKSVTTSWQSFSVTVAIPATSKNVVCAIWTDSQFAANDTVSVAEAGLFVSGMIQAWKPRLFQQELSLCNRYYRKSYALETAPATASAPNYIFVVAYTTSRLWANVFYEVEMRTAPTITIISLAGTTAKASKEADGLDIGTTVTVLIGAAKILSLVTDSGTAFTVGTAYIYHYTADAEIA